MMAVTTKQVFNVLFFVFLKIFTLNSNCIHHEDKTTQTTTKSVPSGKPTITRTQLNTLTAQKSSTTTTTTLNQIYTDNFFFFFVDSRSHYRYIGDPSFIIKFSFYIIHIIIDNSYIYFFSTTLITSCVLYAVPPFWGVPIFQSLGRHQLECEVKLLNVFTT